jgi:hypothetical protein
VWRCFRFDLLSAISHSSIISSYAVNGFRDTTSEIRDKIARGVKIELIKDAKDNTTHLKVDGVTVRASNGFDARITYYDDAIKIWN